MPDCSMRIETIATVERLHDIEMAWDELYSIDPHAHLYLSSDFLCAIAPRVAGNFRVLTAWSDDGRCVGLLPLMVTTQWSKSAACLTNVLDMLGHVFDADYTGILCDPEVEQAVCEAFAREVSKMDFARIILNYFNSSERRLNLFTDAFDARVFTVKANQHLINDGQTDNLICPHIELPKQFDDYLAGLSANSRQKLRRLLRQLDEEPALTIHKSRPETYTRDVTILSQLWYQKHVHQKGQKRATRLAELFKEVVMLGLAQGMVYLAILWKDGQPVAAQANYVDRVKRHVLFHVSGRDERVRDLSVGLMLQAHCIRWAIANGMQRFDFTIGNEPYKHSLGGIDRHIVSTEVSTLTGANVADILDEDCKEDVLTLIRRYEAAGNSERSRKAAAQAIQTWPELGDDSALRRLASPS